MLARRRIIKTLDKESKTQAHLAQRTNVNYLMKQYRRTGEMPDPAGLLRRQQVFLDCTQIGDFAEVQQRIVDAGNQFRKLDPRVRAKFQNRPEMLIAFLQDENNREEAIKLGLIEKPQKQAPEKPEKETPKTPSEG